MFIYMIFKSDEVTPVIVLTNNNSVKRWVRRYPEQRFRVVKMLPESHRDRFLRERDI